MQFLDFFDQQIVTLYLLATIVNEYNIGIIFRHSNALSSEGQNLSYVSQEEAFRLVLKPVLQHISNFCVLGKSTTLKATLRDMKRLNSERERSCRKSS